MVTLEDRLLNTGTPVEAADLSSPPLPVPALLNFQPDRSLSENLGPMGFRA